MGILYKKVLRIIFLGLCLISLTLSILSQNMFRKINDFDGDGKADFAVTRDVGSSRYWYILQSTGGYRLVNWGLNTDQNVSGDYDGDGKTDIAVFRQEFDSQSTTRYSWFCIGSLIGQRTHVFTTNAYPNVVGHQQDYDGDGKTDEAWTIEGNYTSFIGAFSTNLPTGAINSPGGKLMRLGDMSGDGKADQVGYDSINNVVTIQNFLNGTTRAIRFGISSDQFVAADFDGDGKGDLTIFRQSDGTWWWMRSSDNVVNAAKFGTSGDVPVPADYDGDGKTDLAIWRGGSQSYFWVYGSQVGVFTVPWGIASDTVVRY
jgi:hypothetical protein